MSAHCHCEQANDDAVRRIVNSDPMLVDIRRAGDVVAGLRQNVVLAAGTALAWPDYTGPQREAIVQAAVHEGLAENAAEAVKFLDTGHVVVEPNHAHGCIGSSAGVLTASTPVYVVEDRAADVRAYCGMYEGPSRRLLSLGVYDAAVRARLETLQRFVAPTLGNALREMGGLPLRPIIARALRMGDELHTRNLAASSLFLQSVVEAVDRVQASAEARAATFGYLSRTEPLFLRLSMAAAKVALDSAHQVPGSTIVTGMVSNCRELGIRVGGLGDRWFSGDVPEAVGGFFDGYSAQDAVWPGGESISLEAAGLGGLAQAAAFGLGKFHGDSATVIERNRLMYEITVGEHPEYRIPFFGFRGVPVGIDVRRVVQRGQPPFLNVGHVAPGAGLIGAGTTPASMLAFASAAAALPTCCRP